MFGGPGGSWQGGPYPGSSSWRPPRGPWQDGPPSRAPWQGGPPPRGPWHGGPPPQRDPWPRGPPQGPWQGGPPQMSPMQGGPQRGSWQGTPSEDFPSCTIYTKSKESSARNPKSRYPVQKQKGPPVVEDPAFDESLVLLDWCKY